MTSPENWDVCVCGEDTFKCTYREREEEEARTRSRERKKREKLYGKRTVVLRKMWSTLQGVSEFPRQLPHDPMIIKSQEERR